MYFFVNADPGTDVGYHLSYRPVLVLQIRIRIRRIRMFLGLLEPEVWIRIRILLLPSKNSKKYLHSYCFVTSFWFSKCHGSATLVPTVSTQRSIGKASARSNSKTRTWICCCAQANHDEEACTTTDAADAGADAAKQGGSGRHPCPADVHTQVHIRIW